MYFLGKKNKENLKKKKKRVFIFSVFIIFFIIFFFQIIKKNVFAAIVVSEPVLEGMEIADQGREATAETLMTSLDTTENFLTKFYQEVVKKAGSIAFNSVLRNVLNKLAYDTATWLGSGGKGQKPMFMTEGWGKYLANIADEAAGEFIEKFAKESGIPNMCHPSLDLKISIGLGLVQYQRPSPPTCTFSQMKNNWSQALQSKNFLQNFQDMFNPTSNDLGIALSVQTNFINQKQHNINLSTQQRIETKGWLRIPDSIGGNTVYQQYKGSPDAAEKIQEKQIELLNEKGIGEWTGDALVDAANIFLNQLAISLFRNLILSLGGRSSTAPYSGDFGGLLSMANNFSGLNDPDISNQFPGARQIAEQASNIISPRFNVRADYDVLAELSICDNKTNSGPTNCVITDKMRQAIADKETIGNAFKKGYFRSDAIFGFITGNNLEPKISDENLPYRSLMIMRKARIIPVGWEVAAQYIKLHSQDSDVVGHNNLKDMLACFSKNDDTSVFGNFYASWCEGLVDPSWVLKSPKSFCKRVGYGSEILSVNINSDKLNITRKDAYCADEQSCIKEKADGSCEIYGYCTEERRGWNLGDGSCEPIYNTCFTFRNQKGATVSYLENTLDFCDASRAGCREYAVATSSQNNFYATTTDEISWNKSDKLIYLNGNTELCSDAGEGCHAFYRTNINGDKTLIYQKLMPEYLEPYCFRTNSPKKCDNFVSKCSENSQGCELYTSETDEISVPAKASSSDICPAECVGYKQFLQKATFFEKQKEQYFISKTAKRCSASAVGCEEFTNLDKLNKGGEAREYYSYLRKCVKPSAPEGRSCADFYYWEGDDETGYQLKTIQLKSTSNGEPEASGEDSLKCNENIYRLSPGNPGYNPDCRQFYNRDARISYHLYSKTITCSEDCYPYRLSNSNEDDCAWSGGSWTSGSCFYNAISKESKKCSLDQVGCREYSGNKGNNMRTVLIDDFEFGNSWGWTGGEISEASLYKDGHSLKSTSSLVSTLVGNDVISGKTYVLKFLAKADSDTNLKIKLTNETNDAFFEEAQLKTEWGIFEINLPELDHKANDYERLVFEASANFYLDNIKLIEITDKYYLIKNSWETPLSCDQDEEGNDHPQYMLNCDKYRDRENKVHYFRSFQRLCSESEVGCELMIDTKNTLSTTTDDEFIYVVYDRDKKCDQNEKSCERLGTVSYQYEGSKIYTDVYLKNDPDKKDNIVCEADDVGCDAWTKNNGTISYFKNPGEMVCEYRQPTGATSSLGWYKKKVKRCDDNEDGKVSSNDKFCSKDSECESGKKCILDNTDYKCSVGFKGTLGRGGDTKLYYQPKDGWAGLCPANQSGCTEFLDPVSYVNPNLVFNPKYETIGGVFGAGWNGNQQKLKLEKETTYVITGGTAPSDLDIKAGSNIFWTENGTTTITRSTQTGEETTVRRAIIEYKIVDELDFSSCNGSVNKSAGCVLFNQRSRDGNGLKDLIFSAIDTHKDSASDNIGLAPKRGEDSNVILKVVPDRVCDKWLACKSMAEIDRGDGVKENVCFDIGLCSGFDTVGRCNNFITSSKTVASTTFSSASEFAPYTNMSGYSLVGAADLDKSLVREDQNIAGAYSVGAMRQFGEVAEVPNGNFESFGNNSYPLGWTLSDSSGTQIPWKEEHMKVISSPIKAQEEGINFSGNLYAPEGRGFLKLGSTYRAVSERIDVIQGKEYILTAWINTKRLSIGEAKIKINGVSEYQDIVLPRGNDWTLKTAKLKPNGNSITITLQADDNPTGNFYFDDLKLRPALIVRENNYYPQTCRLYSNSDSLSCEYYDDSGKRYKGWPGYCLQYDRPPGNPNACIMWYPVDRVQGDSKDEGAGYNGKSPVYYSLEGKADIVYEYRHAFYYGHLGCGDGHSCPPGYKAQQSEDCDSCLFGGSENEAYCVPGGEMIIGDENNDPNKDKFDCSTKNNISSSKDGWYYYDGDFFTFTNPVIISSTNKYAEFLCEGRESCTISKELHRKMLYTTKIVQTVTPMGYNKYWSGKVFDGSDYKLREGNFELDYLADAKPFGTIAPPEPTDNPYEWDSTPDDPDKIETVGKQPLYEKLKSNDPRSGFVFKCNGDCTYLVDLKGPVPYRYYNREVNNVNNPERLIQKIFAKSYGFWEWVKSSAFSGTYKKANDNNWDVPTNSCGNSRTDLESYCYVAPKVENIQLNNKNNGIIEFNRLGFINLTFTTIVDSQQLPLVTYLVDWGDGEVTSVSGLEMHSRFSTSSPFSLYHLYDYWEIKSKGKNPNGMIPTIIVKDNWGKCNGDCVNDGTRSPVSVTVKEE